MLPVTHSSRHMLSPTPVTCYLTVDWGSGTDILNAVQEHFLTTRSIENTFYTEHSRCKKSREKTSYLSPTHMQPVTQSTLHMVCHPPPSHATCHPLYTLPCHPLYGHMLPVTHSTDLRLKPISRCSRASRSGPGRPPYKRAVLR